MVTLETQLRILARLTATAVLTLALPGASQGEYLGREPERILELLVQGGPDTPTALAEGKRLASEGKWSGAEAAFRRVAAESPEGRFGLAVALLEQGEGDEALREIEKLGVVGEVAGDVEAGGGQIHGATRSRADSPRRYRYADVLVRLRAQQELDFAELRDELDGILAQDTTFHDAFEVWLGLNPSEDELRDHLARLEAGSEPEARVQRAEMHLRLGEPERALADDLPNLQPEEPSLLARARLARARAYYQMSSDAAAQTVYVRMLNELDEPAAELLYRDIAALLSSDERERYAGMSIREREQFFRTFWTQRHPVPSQQINPRIAEHYRRLGHVLREYRLQSNGAGYFTDYEVFTEHSPELPYYDPRSLFDYGRASRYWLDHRGLMYLRHGEPELQMGPRRHGGAEENDSWRLGGYQAQPLVFNFVKRSSIGEWAMALNLAVAAKSFRLEDDPEVLAQELQLNLRRLYSSRALRNVHPIYRAVAQVRGRRRLEEVLRQESQIMSAFVKASLVFDSTDYYTEDNTMPMSIEVTNVYAEGKPAFLIHFQIALGDLDTSQIGPDSSMQTTLILYDENWTKELRRVQGKHPLSAIASTKPEDEDDDDEEESKAPFFLGTLGAQELEPTTYGVVLEAYEAQTGHVGLARGQHTVNYVPPDGIGVSDLLLVGAGRESVRAEDESAESASGGTQWTPRPGRVIRKSESAQLSFELYNLEKDDSGRARYEVEERLLVLQEEPGFWDQMLGIASLAGRMFFPAYTFAAQVGGFTLSQALAGEMEGLTVNKRTEERTHRERLDESYTLDVESLDPGTYTAYVTVKDLNSEQIVSRYLTFRVTDD